jgi:hypothetical protein
MAAGTHAGTISKDFGRVQQKIKLVCLKESLNVCLMKLRGWRRSDEGKVC